MLTKYWSVLYFNAGYFATQFDLLWKLNLICYISIYFPIKAFITFVSFIVSDLFHEISQTLRVLFLNYLRTHIVWESLKMSQLNFLILAFSINFCPIKLTCLVTLLDRKLFKNLPKLTIFGTTLFENHSKCLIFEITNFGIFHQFLFYSKWHV